MMNILNDLTRNERRDLYAYALSVAPWTTIPVTDNFSASAREIADALEYSDGAALRLSAKTQRANMQEAAAGSSRERRTRL